MQGPLSAGAGAPPVGPRSSTIAGNLFFAAVFILCCFPNINAFPFLTNVNNQPIAAILIIFYFMFNFKALLQNKFSGYLLVLLLILFVYALLSAFAIWRFNYEPRFFVVMTIGFSYLVGPLIMIYLHGNYHRLGERLLQFVVGFQVLVVLVQRSGISPLQNAMDVLLGSVLIRFSSEVLTTLDRGAVGTYVEPSHLGRYAIIYFLATIFIYRNRKTLSVRKYLLLAASLFLLVASQSISAVAITALGIGLLFLKSLMLFRLGTILQAAVIGITIGLIVLFAGENSRFAVIPEKLAFLAFIVETTEQFEVLDLQNFGGIRLVNMVIGYKALAEFPFGQGIGSSNWTMLDTAYQVGVPLLETNLYQEIEKGNTDVEGVRKPQGIGAQYAYDFGWLGIVCIFFLAGPLLLHFLSIRTVSILVVTPLLGLFMILFYTTTTFPVPWMMVALVGWDQKRIN